MYLEEFLIIAISHFFAVASPGPDFAIVLKHSVQFGRRNALYTSIGIALGILVHVTYCLLGVAVVIASSESVFNGLKYLAATYLAYLGIQALQSKAKQNTEMSELPKISSSSSFHAMRKGFLVNALNPKATLFFLSLFTLVIDTQTPTAVQLGYGVYMAMATWLWFSLLSVLLSQQKVRLFFLKTGHWFDRGIGIVLILLALRVVFL